MAQAAVALVNETYPSDCIRFRSVLSPLQARFRVDGTPTATANEEPTTEAEPSVPDSLPLKPSRREQRKSPETSQSSTGNSAPAGPPPEVVIEKRIQEAAAAETRVPDTLDDIIREAKAASHLVSTAYTTSFHFLAANKPTSHLIRSI